MARKIGVIIPAAGTGKRLGGVAKPLIEVGGRSLILRVLDLFTSFPRVAVICLAVPPESISVYKKIASSVKDNHLMRIVAGGSERAISVRNAYGSVAPILSEDDLVCIHDAARPLLAEEDLERVVAAGWNHGAAFLAAKVKDTLKTVDSEGYSTSTVDRSRIYAAQTPQVFKSKHLNAAYGMITDYTAITDEVMLMERIGVRSVVVEAKHTNFKITTADDLALLNRLIS